MNISVDSLRTSVAKTLLLAALVFGAGTGLAFANDADKPEADMELIYEFVEYCKEVAEDEGTGDMTLPAFLLNCVNEELAAEGYRPITKLPE